MRRGYISFIICRRSVIRDGPIPITNDSMSFWGIREDRFLVEETDSKNRVTISTDPTQSRYPVPPAPPVPPTTPGMFSNYIQFIFKQNTMCCESVAQ